MQNVPSTMPHPITIHTLWLANFGNKPTRGPWPLWPPPPIPTPLHVMHGYQVLLWMLVIIMHVPAVKFPDAMVVGLLSAPSCCISTTTCPCVFRMGVLHKTVSLFTTTPVFIVVSSNLQRTDPGSTQRPRISTGVPPSWLPRRGEMSNSATRNNLEIIQTSMSQKEIVQSWYITVSMQI